MWKTKSETFILKFDSDKIGKDKSLGKLNLDVSDVLSFDWQGGKWFPLTGVKSGQLLLSADFLDIHGRDSDDFLRDLLRSDIMNNPNNVQGRRNFSDPSNTDDRKSSIEDDVPGDRRKQSAGRVRRPSTDINAGEYEGKVVVTLVKAKDLIKSDLIVLDSDNIGKDKSLGQLRLHIDDDAIAGKTCVPAETGNDENDTEDKTKDDSNTNATRKDDNDQEVVEERKDDTNDKNEMRNDEIDRTEASTDDNNLRRLSRQRKQNQSR